MARRNSGSPAILVVAVAGSAASPAIGSPSVDFREAGFGPDRGR